MSSRTQKRKKKLARESTFKTIFSCGGHGAHEECPGRYDGGLRPGFQRDAANVYHEEFGETQHWGELP